MTIPVGLDIGNDKSVIASLTGSSAVVYFATNPGQPSSQQKRLVGRQFDEPDIRTELDRLHHEACRGPDGGISFKIRHADQECLFTATEILGQHLSHLKRKTETAIGSPISGCVIGVPSYFSDKQMREYTHAAGLAGLNLLGFLHEGLAAAIAFGRQRAVRGNVVFVDVGHLATQVTVVRFSDEGMVVLGHSFDRDLGGRDFDEVVFQYLLRCIENGNQLEMDMRAMRAACEKAKRALTAETEAVIGMGEGVRITRERFEQLASELLGRVVGTCRRAMDEAGLKVDCVEQVELLGLGSSIPAIKKFLDYAFGRKTGRTLDARKCVAHGCALRCAMLTPTMIIEEGPKVSASSVATPLHSGSRGDISQGCGTGAWEQPFVFPVLPPVETHSTGGAEISMQIQSNGPTTAALVPSGSTNLLPGETRPKTAGGSQQLRLLAEDDTTGIRSTWTPEPPASPSTQVANRRRTGAYGDFDLNISTTTIFGTERKEAQAKWEDLPLDVMIVEIAQKMASPGDVVRFGAACKAFNIAADAIFSPPAPAASSSLAPIAASSKQQQQWRNTPTLARTYPREGVWQPVLPVQDDGADLIYKLPILSYRLPTRDCVCIGSSLGLLGFYDRLLRFFLFDPRTGVQVPMPTPSFPNILRVSKSPAGSISYTMRGKETTSNLYSTPFYSPSRLVVSSRTARHPVALCVYERGGGRTMIYCFFNGDNWNKLSTYQLPRRFSCASHVYYRGRFHLLDRSSMRLFTCNITPRRSAFHPIEEVLVEQDSLELVKEADSRCYAAEHLVECGGDLLLVVETASAQWWLKGERRCTFRVFKLELASDRERNGRWVELTDIGPHALFLGRNDPFSLSAQDFPGFRRNHIYLHAPFRIVSEFFSNTGPSHYGYLDYNITERSWERVACNWLPACAFQSFWLDPRVRT